MNTQHKNIAFFGTPQLAVWVLEELAEAHILPSLVVTPPDKPAGRKLTLTAPAVKIWADEQDIPTLQPASLKDRVQAPELANTEWDLFIVAAYNIILPPWVLALPKQGVLNVHPSLLPKLRGPSPIRSALLRDEQSATGVSVMLLDEQIDHGPIVAQARVELPEWPIPGLTLDELLFREGGRLLAEVVPLWLAGSITPETQNDDEATYSQKFSKKDGELDLDGDDYRNYCQYCAMQGWPGTFFFTERHNVQIRVKITAADYRDGRFVIEKVIPEGKKEMAYDAFMRSQP